MKFTKKLVATGVLLLVFTMLFQFYYSLQEQRKPLTSVLSIKKGNHKDDTYVLQPMEFEQFDNVLYKEEKGAIRVIGHTVYRDVNGVLGPENLSLLAVKYEGELSNEWRTKLFVAAVYSDGSTEEAELGDDIYGKPANIWYHYRDGNDTIVFYRLGNKELGSHLARLDYIIGTHSKKDKEFQTMELASSGKIKFPGIERMPAYKQNGVQLTLTDSKKKVYIQGYSYKDGIVTIKGSVISNIDTAINDDVLLFLPSQEQTYAAHTQKSELKKGMETAFSIDFKLDGPLSIQDEYAEVYVYGLGTRLFFHENTKIIHIKPLISHPFTAENVRTSDALGMKDASGMLHHNAVEIQMNDIYHNLIASSLQTGRITHFQTIPLGRMYTKLQFNAHMRLFPANGELKIHPNTSSDAKVIFYSFHSPVQMNDKQIPEDLLTGKLSELTILRELTFTNSISDISNIELDVSNADYLGIYIDSPSYDIKNEFEKHGKNLMLTNAQLEYK
jgi:hypothetical protein